MFETGWPDVALKELEHRRPGSDIADTAEAGRCGRRYRTVEDRGHAWTDRQMITSTVLDPMPVVL